MKLFVIASTVIHILSFFAATSCDKNIADESPVNATTANDELLHRIKRFLVFTGNGGLVKVIKRTNYSTTAFYVFDLFFFALPPQNVLGIAFPVAFASPPARSLNVAYNFQSQYLAPPNPINIFAAPALAGASRSSKMIHAQPDFSRQYVYNLLETLWENRGLNGRECLQRAICEVASSPYSHNGMFGEIVDLIFTPESDDDAVDDEDEDLHYARQSGLNHADCEATFSDCAQGEGFLDSVTQFLHH